MNNRGITSPHQSFYFRCPPLTGRLEDRMLSLIVCRHFKRLWMSLTGILHVFISFFTHSIHVFFGLPRPRVPPCTSKFIISFSTPSSLCTCPYHRKRWHLNRSVIEGIWSCLRSESDETLSSHLTPQIQRIMDLSLLWRRATSAAFGAQHSEACSIALRTYVS